MNAGFTETQTEAYRKAVELLGEHFENLVVLVRTPVDGEPEQEATNFSWRGGKMTAIGLCEHAKSRLVDQTLGRLQ